MIKIAEKSIKYGEYAFLGGILIAVVLGVLSNFLPVNMPPFLLGILFLFGVIVGLANIREKEVNGFLIAAIALLAAATSWNTMLGATFGLFGPLGTTVASWIGGFTGMLVAFVSPAAFIVSLKAVYTLAKPD